MRVLCNLLPKPLVHGLKFVCVHVQILGRLLCLVDLRVELTLQLLVLPLELLNRCLRVGNSRIEFLASSSVQTESFSQRQNLILTLRRMFAAAISVFISSILRSSSSLSRS